MELNLFACKITFLPVIYRQVKLHRGSHICSLRMRYEEAAGRVFLILGEGPPVLESSTHHCPPEPGFVYLWECSKVPNFFLLV